MKYLKYFKENIQTDQEYLDYLLDKINNTGILSLSPAEKSSLIHLSQKELDEHNVEIADGDLYVNGVLYNRFISSEYKELMYPIGKINFNDILYNYLENMNIENISLFGKKWNFRIEHMMSGEHIYISNGEEEYYISPFWEDQDAIAVNSMDSNISFFYSIDMPDVKNMKGFIDLLFNKYLPEILLLIDKK